MRDQTGARVHQKDWIDAEVAISTRPKIFFLASRGALFQGLFQAIRDHFHGFDVSLVDRLPQDEEPDRAVRLVLLSSGKSGNFAPHALTCRRQFPTAAIGMVVEDETQEIDDHDGSMAQGVLPLSLPLDVWLAVMSLLISGGQFFPAEIRRSSRMGGESLPAMHRGSSERPSVADPDWSHSEAHPVPDKPALPSAERDAQAPPDSTQSIGIATLTPRERQTLELVSQGYQNKLIADHMALSEHTVKAHVHNVIAKLRVSNRTQAAAAFLRNREDVQFRPGDERAARQRAPTWPV